jgi:hypothetical protein
MEMVAAARKKKILEGGSLPVFEADAKTFVLGSGGVKKRSPHPTPTPHTAQSHKSSNGCE